MSIENKILGIEEEQAELIKDKSEEYFNENKLYEYMQKGNKAGILLNGRQLQDIMPKRAKLELFSGKKEVEFNDHVIIPFKEVKLTQVGEIEVCPNGCIKENGEACTKCPKEKEAVKEETPTNPPSSEIIIPNPAPKKAKSKKAKKAKSKKV